MEDSSDRAILCKVISGGQTGVDRGALEAAIQLGIEHGGVCPQGRLAEDGRVPDRFQLTEMRSRRYSVRTEQNVIDSDGTLILFNGKLSGGTAFTHRMTIKNRRPSFLFDMAQPAELEDVADWMIHTHIGILNCAGPRESSNPGIESVSRGLFFEIFSAILSRWASEQA